MFNAVRLRTPGLIAVLALGGCAGAFHPRSEPIDLDASSRKVSVSVEGPEDMPEWGELLWVELVQALSVQRVAKVVESGPGVLQIRATVETWDYGERAEARANALLQENGKSSPPAYYRQCTALMGVAVEVSDPATGKVLAQRRYLGVERFTQDLPHDKFRAPKAAMRRAAAKAASQLADDLEAGRGAGAGQAR